MKKRNILKENKDFNKIIKENRGYKYKDFIVYVEKNTNDIYHFGFSVGKKIGTAVTRNKIKRQLRSIIDKNDYQNNFNCIIIVRKSILEKTYQEKEKILLEAFHKLNIIKEKNNEKK